MIGDPKLISFELTSSPGGATELYGLGWSALRLWIGGHLVWAGENGEPIKWTWIDLVEHLARAWGHLEFEETAPFGLTAPHPGKLRESTYVPASVARGSTRLEVEDAVHAFQHRHDLAAGLHGINLPAVWIVRKGNMVHLHSEGHDVWASYSETAGVLAGFVAELKKVSAAPQGRAKDALKAWQRRKPSNTLRRRLQTELKNLLPTRSPKTGQRRARARS